MENGGDGENRRAEGGPAWSDEQAEKDDGFKRYVGREEIGNGGTNPYAQGQRDKKERQEGEGLLRTALLGKEEPTEGGGAREHTGDGRHNTQLHQQGDQNEPVGHVNSV